MEHEVCQWIARQRVVPLMNGLDLSGKSGRWDGCTLSTTLVSFPVRRSAMPSATFPKWALVVFAFLLGSALTIALVVGMYFAVAAYHRPPPETAPVFTRTEFTKKVLGKSESEVIQAVGKPDDTSEDSNSRYWHFKRRTRDPLTNEKDTDVQVVIKQGRVANVNY
jgi:hypothetical protein